MEVVQQCQIGRSGRYSRESPTIFRVNQATESSSASERRPEQGYVHRWYRGPEGSPFEPNTIKLYYVRAAVQALVIRRKIQQRTDNPTTEDLVVNSHQRESLFFALTLSRRGGGEFGCPFDRGVWGKMARFDSSLSIRDNIATVGDGTAKPGGTGVGRRSKEVEKRRGTPITKRI